MRIEKFCSSKAATLLGLKPINLTSKKLGSVIALVGKNGAGKSRVLKLVEAFPAILTPSEFLEDYISHLPNSVLEAETPNINFAIKKYNAIRIVTISDEQRRQQLGEIQETLKGVFEKLQETASHYIKVVDSDDLITIKEKLEDDLTFEQILNNVHLSHKQDNKNGNNSKKNTTNEFKLFNSSATVNYFSDLSKQDVVKKFANYVSNDAQKQNENNNTNLSPDRFARFKFFLKKFLGKEFSYQPSMENDTIKSSLTLDGKPFNITQLSPGQKTLFAYAVLLFYLEYNTQTNLRECIIIIDEPEKHLHPEAQIILIDTLRDLVKEKGQLWIATHSINILSHLHSDEILFVENDEVFPPSRLTPGHSFKALMGYENYIDELSTFINSISQWAYANFMVQCFIEPDVIFSNDINDPQYKLFFQFVKQFDHIKLLDYGAGKGRIGYTIQEDNALRNKIQYSAFDPNKDNLPFLSAIPNISTYTDNLVVIDSNSMDCVILCNVLHEIVPQDWKETFDNIKRVLKKGGYLLILEDKYLPKGETAHEFGYLILDRTQLEQLFSTSNVLQLKAENNYKERITFCAIKKEDINVASYTINRAISSLEKESFEELKRIRSNKNTDVASGRQYANVTQLYINAKMALEKLNGFSSFF